MQLSRIAAVGASVAAFFGSCCALPLLLIGLTGTVGFATVLVPYQKYFMVLTIILLGTAFYLVYGRKQPACENLKLCSPTSQKWTKVLLWISIALTAIFLIGPHLITP
ncbi:MAG: mercury transporter MerT [Deltaproteobacteria bacterium]|nr:mercury transporter MerT [Deltaproteobacteria bacterium]